MKKFSGKRLLTVLLTLALLPVFSGLSHNYVTRAEEDCIASGTAGSGISWVLSYDGTLTVSGTGLVNASPWYAYKESISSVIVESGITGLGRTTFEQCRDIVSVSLPDGLTSGAYAFTECEKLRSIHIPSSVSSIGEGAFSYCAALTSVSIPEGISTVPGMAFFDCAALTSVSLPSSLTSVGEYAFDGTALTGVHFAGTAEEWSAVAVADK